MEPSRECILPIQMLVELEVEQSVNELGLINLTDSPPANVDLLAGMGFNPKTSSASLLEGLDLTLDTPTTSLFERLHSLDGTSLNYFYSDGSLYVAKLVHTYECTQKWAHDHIEYRLEGVVNEKYNMADKRFEESSPYDRDSWWVPDEDVEWNPTYKWFEPDPYHEEFFLFSSLPSNLRMRILRVAAMDNYTGRVICVPQTGSRDWHFIYRRPIVQRKATNAVIPLPLTKTTKEARNAVFEASTCHLWVTNRLGSILVKPSRVKKLHFRPNDVLVIDDLEYICARLFYLRREMVQSGFSKGIKRLIAGEICIKQCQKSPQSFINAMHAFPDLEVLQILEWQTPGFHWHLNIFEPFLQPSSLFRKGGEELLGTISLDLLCKRNGKKPLEVKFVWMGKMFNEIRTDIKDWPVDLSF